MMVIIDTDILIDAARGVDQAANCLLQVEADSSLAVSVITQMELIVGCRNKKELNALDQFLKRFDIISLNQDISDTAADLLRTYRLSHGLLIPDALIAATAMTSGNELISKNQKDYRFIKDLKLLPYV